MKNPINILFSSDWPYAQLLLTAVKSLFQEAEDSSIIRLYIIDRGIPEHYKQALAAYVSDACSCLCWIDGDREALKKNADIPASFFELPETGHYDRLLAPFFIDDPKVLYLDTDILIQGDVTELWETGFDGHPIVAVQDQIIPTIDSDSGIIDWEALELKSGVPYFNSGVMLMDLERWRSDGLCAACCECALAFIERFDGPPPLHDQYALNVVCYQDWKSASLKWNTFAEKVSGEPEDACIVHFAGSHKPFHRVSGAPAPSKFFIRKAQKLMHEDFIETQETAECLARLQSHHQWLDSRQAPLYSPNNNPISFAPPCDLAVDGDEGGVAVVMPVMIRDQTSLRFESFCFLVERYLLHVPDLIIVEQITPDSEQCIKEFLAKLDNSKIHHLEVKPEDDKIHKSSLINHGSRYAFETLTARYVWQIDADIYVDTRAVLNQLNILNSARVPVIRPLLYFVRLNEEQSEEIKALPLSKTVDHNPADGFFSPYQIIDLFGPGTVIFNKEAFVETGGMDESYKGWGWEDMDFAERLSAFHQPHTLPLTGVHLHHEEDRLPHLENYDSYCQSHRDEASDEEKKQILVHTIFHNFLTKFCVITVGASTSAEPLFAAIRKMENVLFRSAPIEQGALPQNREMASALADQIIYSLASESKRFAGFHWDTISLIIAPSSQQPIQADRLLDLMVSSGFHIVLVIDDEYKSSATQLIARRLYSLINLISEKYQRPVDKVLLKATAAEFRTDPDAVLAACTEHLRFPSQ